MSDCIFCRIASGRLGTPFLHEDDDIVAFADQQPQAPIHVLLIPRAHIPTTLALEPTHDRIVGKLIRAAATVARGHGVADAGFRLVLNTNHLAGQSVYHLHVHLLAGRGMRWPPG